MSRYYLIACIMGALTLSGCVTLPEDNQLYQEPPAPWEVEENNSRLRDIDNLIQKGRNFVAKQQAEVINPAQLNVSQQSLFNLLYAQILLSAGEAEQAIKKLALVQVNQLSKPNKIKFFQSQSFAHSLTGNLLESTKARISLDEFLTKPSERKNNQEVILETLGFLPPSNLRNTQQSPAGFTEWLSAAKILASKNRNASEFNSSLTKWRAAYPSHPANYYLSNIAKVPESIGPIPDSIAILLPESGPYMEAASAIKAGFMAAHAQYRNSHTGQPELHFYDTEKGKPSALYTNAINAGAKLVIGPLNKDNIQNLANSAFLTVPVLALNHVPSLNKANLYQFALSPIDDAAEITKKAAADGHKNALILAPDNELGKRTSAYLKENWLALNGTVIDKQVYNPNTSDYSAVLKKLLNTNGIPTSQAFNQNPAIPPTSYPHGADVLFLSASSKEGRMINSALNAFETGGLSVYALPNIYSGLTDPKNDSALNGITFCDVPWLFNGGYNGDLNMLALRNVWNKYPATYIRLIAMGIDAYVLAAKLPTLTHSSIAGASGSLSLATGNRIKRSLICAKFAMGRPELITPSSQPLSPAPSLNEATDPIQVIIRGQ